MSQNSWESVKSDAGYFALGGGTYLGLVWVFLCYPSFIISLCITRGIYGIIPNWNDGAKTECFLVCLGLMVLFSIITWFLVMCRQWFILLSVYLITLWPFLYIIGHFSGPTDGGPIPIDFWPLW
jgi:hypothetical protein